MNRTKKKPKNRVEALIALHLVHQLGKQRIRLLLQIVDHPAEVFTLSSAELEKVEGIGSSTADTLLNFNSWNEVDLILEKTSHAGAEIITFNDDAYPSILREIYDPPLLLWVKGSTTVLGEPGVAVVGTRRATEYGKKRSKKFSRKLAEQKLVVVSGLAFGADAAAHRATLEAGGKTVAVLGSGIDVIYPPKHAGLADEIINKGGTVISEFLPGAPPDACNFPERNRIVSGLTLGTLVVESPLKGGSMITAQLALMQNREVFVVPHSLDNANGVGCNHLIKRGAGKLVQTIDDILEEIPLYIKERPGKDEDIRQEPNWQSLDLDEESRKICELLDGKAMHIDDMSEELSKPSHQLLAKLLELEMQECVRQRAGKRFELV